MDVTRREALAIGGLTVAGLALGRGLSYAAPDAVSGGLVPELVTVTERGFVCWWLTDAPSDTTLVLKAPGRAPRTLALERDQTVHVAAVGGLKPGTTYEYELRSGDTTIPTSVWNPGTVTTQRAPRGRLLATVALMNDLHVGEGCSGTIQTINGQSFPPCNKEQDYAVRMSSAAVRAIRALRPKVDFVFVNGDLTAEAQVSQVPTAVGILQRLKLPFDVTRGNHDRRHKDTCAPDDDCFRQGVRPGSDPRATIVHWAHDVGRRLTAIGLDSADPDSGQGRLDLGGQLDFLEAQLERTKKKGRRVLLGFHHPVTTYAELSLEPPVLFGVNPEQGGNDVLDLLGRYEHVALVVHGHTHRNYVSYDPRSGEHLPFVENGAVKEYPGGFGLLRFHEGGVLRTFHRVSEPWHRQWIATTATQVYGRHPDYTRGPLSSRAFATDYATGAVPPASTVPGVPDPPFVGS